MQVDTVLRCEHLVRFYDTASERVQAIRGVDLTVPAAATTAIVGPSGSGKSSLLRMLVGLDRPTAGRVLLDGADLWLMTERQRARARANLLTHVYQRPSDNLYAHLTARMHLERVARSGSSPSAAAATWLELVGLGHRAEHVPAAMSGGERQRLAFARAAVAGHRLVVADEPTSQLDSVSAALVLDAIDVLTGRGITVVLATHDRRVLDRMSNVVALRDGVVATITTGGSELAVIDGSGRLQLPPDVQERFPERRVRIVRDAATGTVGLERP